MQIILGNANNTNTQQNNHNNQRKEHLVVPIASNLLMIVQITLHYINLLQITTKMKTFHLEHQVNKKPKKSA